MSSGDLLVLNFEVICYYIYLLSAPQNWEKESLIGQYFFVGPIRESQLKKEKTNICTSNFEILSN